jgi:hypothetical protein
MSRNAKSDEISHLTCNDRVINDSADLTECLNLIIILQKLG